MTDKLPVTTSAAGVPIDSDEFSLSVGPDGPLLMQDHYVLEKMAHFNRERVPERSRPRQRRRRPRLLRGDEQRRPPVVQGRLPPAGETDRDVRTLLDRGR